MNRQDATIGTPVIYWGVIKDNGEKFEPFRTTITSDVWELGHGEPVCKIAGRSGGFTLRHLEPNTGQYIEELDGPDTSA